MWRQVNNKTRRKFFYIIVIGRDSYRHGEEGKEVFMIEIVFVLKVERSRCRNMKESQSD